MLCKRCNVGDATGGADRGACDVCRAESQQLREEIERVETLDGWTCEESVLPLPTLVPLPPPPKPAWVPIIGRGRLNAVPRVDRLAVRIWIDDEERPDFWAEVTLTEEVLEGLLAAVRARQRPGA